MTLYGMLDYGRGFDPLLRVKLTPGFFSVQTNLLCSPSLFRHALANIHLQMATVYCIFGSPAEP